MHCNTLASMRRGKHRRRLYILVPTPIYSTAAMTKAEADPKMVPCSDVVRGQSLFCEVISAVEIPDVIRDCVQSDSTTCSIPTLRY